MAISLLTDSEKKVFEEVYGNTQAKIKKALMESGLPEITAQIKAEVERLRQQNDEIHRNTEDVPWLSKFVANIFKSGAGEAEKKYPSRKKP